MENIMQGKTIFVILLKLLSPFLPTISGREIESDSFYKYIFLTNYEVSDVFFCIEHKLIIDNITLLHLYKLNMNSAGTYSIMQYICYLNGWILQKKSITQLLHGYSHVIGV